MNILDYIKTDSCLKLDYNTIKEDVSKLVHNEVGMYPHKKTKVLLKKAFYIGFVGIVLLSLTLFIIFINNNGNNLDNERIDSINNSISNLDNIEDDEQRMIEISKIDKQIQDLPEEEQKSINSLTLDMAAFTTANALRDNVKWNNYLSNDVAYFRLENIVDLNKINTVTLGDLAGYEDNNTHIIENKEKIKGILELIDVPYSSLINDADLESDEANLENVKNAIEMDCDLSLATNCFLKGDLSTDEHIDIYIYSNGYVLIKIYSIGYEGKNEINSYASLVKIDYNIISNVLNEESLEKGGE